jgi:small subunit ribosomal protein S20
MPQKKQAEKALRQAKKRTLHNKKITSHLSMMIKKTRRSAEAGTPDVDMLTKTIKALDKAAQKGLVKKNTAARNKSRLTILINKSKAAKK